MPELKSSPYQRHRNKWLDCERCELHERRKKVVLARGRLPCDVLFVGEAPGVNEDVIGQPFIGPAGVLLDEMIADTDLGAEDIRLAFTNLIACIPKDKDDRKVHAPPKQCIKACRPRLEEFIELNQPRLQVIVRVGEHATKHCPIVEHVEYADITHPAAILRMTEAQRPLAIKRVLATLQTVAVNLTPF